ncbi:SPOSA6832_02046, partial [Sporobolomyces salmonicolor]
MASPDPGAALVDRTNALLTAFHQHAFKSAELSAAVPHTENLTRFTQDATSMTGVTGVSDSGLIMDSADKERALEDLALFKDHVATLKFAYLESNARLEFVNHIVLEPEYKTIPKEANDDIAQKRLQAKAELREKKLRCAELESLIRAEAQALEEPMRRREQEAQYAAQLVRECEAMETEIAMLKNKRSPTERITIPQATSILDAQLAEIESLGRRTLECEAETKALRPRIKASRLNVDKLGQLVKQLRAEQEERDAKGMQDVRAEEGIDQATLLYKSLLGIHNAYAIGSPPTEMILEYGSARAEKGDLRALSVSLGTDGRMIGARLVDSSENIKDLVDAYLPSQDVQSLVQEVRARIGR